MWPSVRALLLFSVSLQLSGVIFAWALRRTKITGTLTQALPGLRGVVKISHTVIKGISLINLDGFAPASQWEELPAAPASNASRSNTAEVSR